MMYQGAAQSLFARKYGPSHMLRFKITPEVKLNTGVDPQNERSVFLLISISQGDKLAHRNKGQSKASPFVSPNDSNHFCFLFLSCREDGKQPCDRTIIDDEPRIKWFISRPGNP